MIRFIKYEEDTSPDSELYIYKNISANIDNDDEEYDDDGDEEYEDEDEDVDIILYNLNKKNTDYFKIMNEAFTNTSLEGSYEKTKITHINPLLLFNLIQLMFLHVIYLCLMIN